MLFLTVEPVERWVIINFRKIRDSLHYEITVDHLIQEGIIEHFNPRRHDSRLWRGQLVKESIKKGKRACESLMTCIRSQSGELHEYCVMTCNKKLGGKNIIRAEIRKRKGKNSCRIT